MHASTIDKAVDDRPNERNRFMSRAKTIAITVGSLTAGALLATGVTGIAAAADSTPSPSATSGSSGTAKSAPQNGAKGGLQGTDRQQGRDGQGGGRHGGPKGGMLGGPGGQALHGEIVVKKADGTISTVRLIDGTVTAVTSDSITVKAADDFTATYTVNATTDIHVGLPTGRPGHDAQGTSGSTTTKPATSTIADVKVGDVARVEGTVSGSTATATEIHAMTAAQAAQLEQQRQQHDAQRGAQAPGATASSSASAA